MLLPVERDIVPGERTAAQPRGLLAGDDRLPNFRRRKCQPENPRDVGLSHVFARRHSANCKPSLLVKALPPAPGLHDRPDQRTPVAFDVTRNQLLRRVEGVAADDRQVKAGPDLWRWTMSPTSMRLLSIL